MQNTLFAISPLDGRYAEQCQALTKITSEYGLLYYRTFVEIEWLIALSQNANIPECPQLSSASEQHLRDIITHFSLQDAEKIKQIERTTQHDVKAVEYFLKEKLAQFPELKPHLEFIHFAATSEDINNVAYGLMLQQVRNDVLLPKLAGLSDQIKALIQTTQHTAMLSRTHGQAATPTTLGKELANVYVRMQRQIEQLQQVPILAKFSGAVGNFNAHVVAYPDVDWLHLTKTFIEKLGLEHNAFTTQIEPHDFIAEYAHTLCRLNTILIDFSEDIWHYISLGYFSQTIAKGQVGSSTMPHKVNPIDFENAEGNLGLSNALWQHFANKLPISRMQRDLSDSTVLRNLGVALGHCLLAYHSLSKGLQKLAPETAVMQAELNNHWELLAEAIQTVMRKHGLENPYETLKNFSQGKQLDQASIQQFITGLPLPSDEKAKLLKLTPSSFIGESEKLVGILLAK